MFGQMSTLEFLVVNSSGEPMRNAEIVLSGHQGEVQTHEDGKASVSGIPYGKLRVQVIAPGYNTYTATYDVNQYNQEITVKLQKSAKQYSIIK